MYNVLQGNDMVMGKRNIRKNENNAGAHPGAIMKATPPVSSENPTGCPLAIG